MKNTKLLIGLAVGGGLAYLYSKSKKSSLEPSFSNDEKSSSQPSFSVGSVTYYTKNGKYYQESQVQCFKAPCSPYTSEISKTEYDNAKLKTVASIPTVSNGANLPKGDAVAEYKPVYKGYDPIYNASLENQKQMQALYESDFWKSKNPQNPTFEKLKQKGLIFN